MVENSMEACQKTKNRTTTKCSNTTPGHISEGILSQDTIKTLAQPCLLKPYSQ
jgi:hypothetical protein